MKILVTGGGGFIGGAVVDQLIRRGDDVTSFARGDYPALRDRGVRTVRGDLRDPSAVKAAVTGHDLVIHTAAMAGAWGPEQQYWASNVLGSQHVIDACRSSGVPRLVFTSSPSVVHTGSDIEGDDERLPYALNYLAAYPATKAEAERRVLAANSADLLTTALRPHLVWGPGDLHFVPRIIERARRGRLPIIGSGENLIDTTYIDNAARAHLDAVDRLGQVTSPDHAPAGRVYFIAQGEPAPMRDLLNQFVAAADVPPVTRHVPVRMAWAVGALAERLHRWGGSRGEPLMTRYLVQQFATAHWFDLSAARRDLGYTPSVTTAEGMLRLREYLRSR